MNSTIANLVLVARNDRSVFPILADAFADSGDTFYGEFYQDRQAWLEPKHIEEALDYLYGTPQQFKSMGLEEFYERIEGKLSDNNFLFYLNNIFPFYYYHDSYMAKKLLITYGGKYSCFYIYLDGAISDLARMGESYGRYRKALKQRANELYDMFKILKRKSPKDKRILAASSKLQWIRKWNLGL